MKTDINGCYDLELCCNKGETFIYFWDSAQGNDVCVQLKDGKIFESVYHEDEDEVRYEKEITLEDFIKSIESSIKSAGDFYAH